MWEVWGWQWGPLRLYGTRDEENPWNDNATYVVAVGFRFRIGEWMESEIWDWGREKAGKRLIEA